ncbi:MAG: SDR family NAD(P)-dependent oxidoreductase [Clostridiaceae bacterium]|nr:SDR family NAD(P)-dependent oxidoreductase [Bacillota bacterium]NLN51985.1 SDR family NAD(P)-dependent oxidoreductase [Clostridiaceae bacterium]
MKKNIRKASTTRRIALITGASSGLGYEFAKQLDLESSIDEIWLVARREHRLEALAEELTHQARVLACDVTDPAWQKHLIKILSTENIQIDTLINSAGMGKKGSVEEIGLANNSYMVDLNCKALTEICSICIPYMAENSRILNVSSTASFLPQPRFAVYAATKAYILSYTRALDKELKPRKITVTAVCPNPMETEFFCHTGQPEEISALKKIGLEDVGKVARKALRRSKRKKDISLQSMTSHLIRLISRIFPHPFVLWIEKKIGL